MKQLFFVFLLPFVGFSQLNHREEHQLNDIRYYEYWELSNLQNPYYNQKGTIVKEAKVQSVTYLHGDKRNAAKVSYRKWYNEDGKIIRTESKNDTVYFTYQDTLLVSIHRITKHTDYLTQVTYDEQQRVATKTVQKNNKLSSTTQYTYFKGQKKTRIERIVLGRKAHSYVLINEFEPLLERISKTTFLIDGEIKQIWNYECNEKGTIVDTKLERVNSECRFEQTNRDGSYSIFNRTIINGKVHLTETLFAADSTRIGYNTYHSDTVLKSSFIRKGNVEESKGFTKHGKLTYHQENKYDDYGNLIEQNTISKNGKRKNTSISETNEQHLIVRSTYNNRFVSLFQYTYF
jgi:hypothetical protein